MVKESPVSENPTTSHTALEDTNKIAGRLRSRKHVESEDTNKSMTETEVSQNIEKDKSSKKPTRQRSKPKSKSENKSIEKKAEVLPEIITPLAHEEFGVPSDDVNALPENSNIREKSQDLSIPVSPIADISNSLPSSIEIMDMKEEREEKESSSELSLDDKLQGDSYVIEQPSVKVTVQPLNATNSLSEICSDTSHKQEIITASHESNNNAKRKRKVDERGRKKMKKSESPTAFSYENEKQIMQDQTTKTSKDTDGILEGHSKEDIKTDDIVDDKIRKTHTDETTLMNSITKEDRPTLQIFGMEQFMSLLTTEQSKTNGNDKLYELSPEDCNLTVETFLQKLVEKHANYMKSSMKKMVEKIEEETQLIKRELMNEA